MLWKGRADASWARRAGFWLLLFALLLGGVSSAHALNFAVVELQELADESDEVFIGVATDREEEDASSHRYTFLVDKTLEGGLAPGDQPIVRVTQFDDEGMLDIGATYLIMLTDFAEHGYAISGTHQGFIKLEDGTSESRFYKPDEVETFFALYQLDLDTAAAATVNERAGAQAGTGESAAQTNGMPSMLSGLWWAAGLALAGLAALTIARGRKR